MENKLAQYMDDLFRAAPQSRKALELKEELLGNMNEKYLDLLDRGCQEEEAYSQVISGLGDIDELLSHLQKSPLDPVARQQADRKNALVISGCVGGYLLGLCAALSLYFLSNGRLQELAPIVFLAIAAVTTCVLVFHILSKPRYIREEETFVEQWKENASMEENRKSIHRSLNGLLWTIVLVIYLIISFITWDWHLTWVIFIAGAVVNLFINLYFGVLKNPELDSCRRRKKVKGYMISILWTGLLIVYFLVSFTFWNWAVSWIVFPIGAALTCVVNLVAAMKE